MNKNNDYKNIQINEKSQDQNLYEILRIILIILGLFITLLLLTLIYHICRYFNWFSKKKIILNLRKNIIILNPDDHISIGFTISTYNINIPRCESYKYKKIKELTVQI